MSRLDQFLDLDDAARDRAAQISTLAGLGGLLIAKNLFGFQGKILGYSVIAVIVCAYLARLWWYCHIASPAEIVETRFLIPRRVAMAAAAAGIFALFIIAPPAVVEAAVLNRKLLELTRKPTLSPDEANGIADGLANASNGTIKLPINTLVLVREAIKNSEPDSAVAWAANALLKYNNDISPPALINPPKTEAQRVFLEAGKRFMDATDWQRQQIDPQKADAVLSGLSRAIEVSASEPSLRIDALLYRATAYLFLRKPAEALADVEAAENYGALDLPSIIWIETDAMMSRRQPKDLMDVVSLTTLGLQIAQPAWERSNVPGAETEYSVGLLRSRATAYYLLGEFVKAEQDCQTALRIPPPSAAPVHFLFQVLICSYLKMGQMNEALAATEEWVARNGDKHAVDVRNILQLHPADPQAALSQLERLFPL